MPTYTATGALTPQGIVQPDVTLRLGFSYTESTNTVVVIGGTSGTPKTFDNFVTADRAGRGTILKDWTTCTTNMTLTYQVRPVEKRALTIKFILAGTSAGAGDTLDITGTDFDDVAQTESIDVSSGNGIYTGTKKWRTITDIDCTGWSDGKLKVTQDIWGVIWNLCGNASSYPVQYQVSATFNIGNATTSTYFASKREHIYFYDGVNFLVTASATLTLGEKVSASETKFGSTWHLGKSTGTYSLKTHTGSINVYGSKISIDKQGTTVNDSANIGFAFSGTNEWIQSIFEGFYLFQYNNSNTTINNVMFLRFWNSFINGNNIGSITVSDPTMIIQQNSAGGAIAWGGWTTQKTLTLIRPVFGATAAVGVDFSIANVLAVIKSINGTYGHAYTCDFNVNGPQTSAFYEQYYCDINICDKNGTAISGATVDCTDADGTVLWGAGTVTTDASGNITQQTISYKKVYADTGVTTSITKTYSPHKFTISKAGYQTLVLENITVSSAIKWHLELQDVAAAEGTTGVKVIRRPQFIAEPEFIPVPVPMDMEGKYNVPEPNPETMTQREYNTWRDRGGR